MNVIKRTLLGTGLVGTAFMVVLASYNTMSIDYTAFTKNDLGIKFSKRLDNITGELVVGRMAASVRKWDAIATAPVAQVAKEIKKEVVVEKSQPAPVVEESLSLELTAGFYNNKSLKDNGAFSGSAIVSNGVIESISVNLPNDEVVDVNTLKEPMVGNIFKYEDTATGEARTGLFYEVKKGTYMITLTNDSAYPNMRLELKTDDAIETQEVAENSNWNMGNEKDAYAEIIKEDNTAQQVVTNEISPVMENEYNEEKVAMQEEIESLREAAELREMEQEEREFSFQFKSL